MNYNFDQPVNRKDSNSVKWRWFDEDVLPMWVADMDFVSPSPVLEALHQRIDHGVFGYGLPPKELETTICSRMERLYNWQVTPEEIIFLPGLVSGINVMCRAINQPGDGVLVQTPVYPPFLSAPLNHDQRVDIAQLAQINNDDGHTLAYEIDFDAFEEAIKPDTNLFILCNPHNPIGRGFNANELTKMAEICLAHDVVLCSDEIHSDLLLGNTKHIPSATLGSEIADRCITLLAPSKSYNIPGLGCSIAIVQNPELREQLEKAAAGIVPHVNVLGYTAALAAYEQGDEWLAQVREYLTANRDYVVDFITTNLPDVRTTVPEATYLAWLDCSAAVEGNPHRFFLEKAGVALNDGEDFGPGGENFVRLNFGCQQATLEKGLRQMVEAVRR
jgi:cystathionine beta-lyase